MAALLTRPEESVIEDIYQENGQHTVSHSQLSGRRLREYFPFRLFRVLLSDPAAFLFVISLFIFSLCMPFLGLYLKSSDNLLDLDTMKVSIVQLLCVEGCDLILSMWSNIVLNEIQAELFNRVS